MGKLIVVPPEFCLICQTHLRWFFQTYPTVLIDYFSLTRVFLCQHGHGVPAVR